MTVGIRNRGSVPVHLIVVFVFLSLVIATVGYLYSHDYRNRIKAAVRDEIETVAKYKVSQIYGWLSEHYSSAKVFSSGPFFAQVAARYFDGEAEKSEIDKLQKRLKSIKETHGFHSVSLYDVSGTPILTDTNLKNFEACPIVQNYMADSTRLGKGVMLDLHLHRDSGRITSGILMPVYDADDPKQIAGFMLFETDPYRYLFNFIQLWPTTSDTAETLLVRGEGSDVIFLNELRHKKGTALNLRLPIDDDDLPSALGVLGKRGYVEGYDYRDEKVLSFIAEVPDTPWILISKMDAAEVFDPIIRREILVALAVVGSIVFVFIALLVFWYRARIGYLAAELRSTAAEKNYAYFVRYASDIILLMDRDFKIINVNDKAIKAYGYSFNQFLTKRISDLRTPEERDKFKAQISDMVSKESVVYETLHKRKDGSIFPIEVSLRFMDIEGEYFYQAIGRDITERREKQQIIKDSEEWFKRLYDEAPIGYYLYDLRGTFLDGNKASEDLVGYKREELIGKNFMKIGLLDARSHIKAATLLALNVAGKNTGPDILTLIRKDGSTIDMEIVSRPINLKGKTFVLGMAQDVTKRVKALDDLKKSEERYRLLADNAIDTIWMMNLDGKFLYHSPSVMRLRGYTPDEANKVPLEKTMTPQSLLVLNKIFAEEARKPMAKRWSDRTLELQMYRKDGSVIWTEVSVRAVRDDRGNVIALQGSARDITDRKKAEERLEESEEMFRQLFENAPDFYSIHDLSGTIVDCNRMAREFLGYSKEEVVGKRFMDIGFIAPKYMPKVLKLLAKSVAGKPTGPDDLEFIKKDGSHAMIEILSSPLVVSGKKVVLVEARDVTERQKSREEIEKLASVVRHTPELVNIVTPDGRMVFLNVAGCKMLGIEEDEVQNYSIPDVMAEDQKALVTKEIFPALRKEGEWDGDTKYRNIKTGEIVDVHAVCFVIKDPFSGEINYFANVSIDITERKKAERALLESEKKYRALYDSSRDGFVLVDMNGNIMESNKAYCDMLGYSKEEILKKRYQDITPKKWHDAESSIIKEQVMKYGYSTVYEKEYIKNDGTIFPVTLRTYLLKDADGSDAGMWAYVRDITEQREIEVERWEAERRYRVLFDALPISVTITSPDGRVLMANKAVKDSLGYTPQEFISMNIGKIYADQRQRFQLIGIMLKDGKVRDFEAKLRRADGSVGYGILNCDWVELRGEKLILTTGRDITEQKEQSIRLTESERRYKLLAENASDFIWTSDLKMTFTYASPACKRLLGYEPQDIIGKYTSFVLTPSSAEKAMMVFIRELAIEKLPLGQKDLSRTRTMELEHRRKDGSTIWCEIKASFLRDEKGGAFGMVGVTRDISDRKMAESKMVEYAALLSEVGEMAKIGGWEADLLTKEVMWTDEVYEIHGIDKNFTPKLDEAINFFAPESSSTLKKSINYAINKGIPYDLELELIRSDGSKIWTRSIGKPVFKDGKVVKLKGAFQDIDDLKRVQGDVIQAYEKLRKAQSELIQSEKLSALGRFASGIAHEVKNPLGIILGGIEFLETRLGENRSEDLKMVISKLKDAALRASNTLTSILQYAKPSSLKMQKVELNGLVDEVVALFRIQPTLVKIDVKLDLTKDKVFVNADKNQIQQVLINMVKNSMEAMPEGGTVIIRTDKRGNYAIIDVIDTGIGMSDEAQRKLFEPFFTTKRASAGTGLGLFIARSIIENHEGSLNIDSEVGKGTKIEIALPVSA